MVTGHYPKTIKEACRLRSQYSDSMLVCGGSDVMVTKKKASHMIFINQIEELKEVTRTNATVTIGAAAVYSDLLHNELVPDLLKQAISKIASPAVRSVGTIAGNICNASPAGDTIPVLYALSAVVVIASEIDEAVSIKRIPIEEFIKGVRKIALEQNEMVIAVEIPRSSYEGMTKVMYEKVGARKSEAISKVSFVGLLKEEEGIVNDIRITFGAVSITAVRRKEIETHLIGKSRKELQLQIEEIKYAYEPFIKPIDDQRSTANYRKTVCLNLLTEFLSE